MRSFYKYLGCGLCAAVAGGIFGAPTTLPAEGELAIAVEFGSFLTLTAKATEGGRMVGNPILPAILLSQLQERLVQEYGQIRQDLPIRSFCYVAADDKGFLKKQADDSFYSCAVLFPLQQRPATFLLDRPGAERDDDGVIRVPPMSEDMSVRYVAYAPGDKYAAFADTKARAKQVLRDEDALTFIGGTERLATCQMFESGFALLPTGRVSKARSRFVAAKATLDLSPKGLILEATLTPRNPNDATRENIFALLREVVGDRLPTSTAGTALGVFEQKVANRKVTASAASAIFPDAPTGEVDDFLKASIYGFLRDTYFPTLVGKAQGAGQAQLKKLVATMPPVAANSHIACAIWRQKDGARVIRMLMSAGELKNIGSAFGAFTAASLATQLDEQKKKAGVGK